MKIKLILLILMMIPAVFAAGEWTQFQNSYNNTGRVPGVEAFWNESGTVITTTDGNTTDHQILITNIDGTGTKEAIFFNGNFLVIYDDNFTKIDESNVGGTDSEPVIYGNKISFVKDWQWKFYTFNGTFFNKTEEYNITSCLNADQDSDIKCVDQDCYYVCGRRYNETYLIKYTNETSIAQYNITGLDNLSMAGIHLAISDIDRDGTLEIVMAPVRKFGAAGNGMAVIEADDGQLDTSFDSDGYKEIYASSAIRTFPIIWNTDGSGDEEIIFGWDITQSCSGIAGKRVPRIEAWNSDGSVKWTYSAISCSLAVKWPCCNINAPSNVYTWEDLFMAKVGSVYKICGSQYINTRGTSFGCLSLDGSAYWSIYDVETSGVRKAPYGLAVPSNSERDYLVFAPRVYEGYTTPQDVTNLSTITTSYSLSAGDISNDGNIEFFGTRTGSSLMITSSYNLCGNDVIDTFEDCDGTNLGGTVCTDLGYDDGTLACGGTCQFDESGCTNDAPGGSSSGSGGAFPDDEPIVPPPVIVEEESGISEFGADFALMWEELLSGNIEAASDFFGNYPIAAVLLLAGLIGIPVYINQQNKKKKRPKKKMRR